MFSDWFSLPGYAGSPIPVFNHCPSVVGSRKTSLTASVRVLIALMGLLCDNSKCSGSCVAFVHSILLVLKPVPHGCTSDRWTWVCPLCPDSDRRHHNSSLWGDIFPFAQDGCNSLSWRGLEELQVPLLSPVGWSQGRGVG